MSENHRCLWCDKPGELHHIRIKGMGGSRDPDVLEDTVPLCYEHHVPLLHDKPYTLSKTVRETKGGNITIYDLFSPSGEWVAGRMFHDRFDEGAFIHHIQGAGKHMAENASSVYLLSHDGLDAVAQAIKVLGKQSWAWQGYLLHAAVSRSVHGEKGDMIADACGRFGFALSRTLAYDIMRCVAAYPDLAERLDKSLLPKSMYLLAATAADPEAALELLEERKADNPRLTVREARIALGKNPHATCPYWDEEIEKCVSPNVPRRRTTLHQIERR